jgi:hypothetical protein
MVKKVTLIVCVLVVLVIATNSLLAYPLGASHMQLNAVPESWSLMALGSVLISGATVLRRRWSPPTK